MQSMTRLGKHAIATKGGKKNANSSKRGKHITAPKRNKVRRPFPSVKQAPILKCIFSSLFSLYFLCYQLEEFHLTHFIFGDHFLYSH